MGNTKKQRHKRISIFVSHLGCPHDCAYCNQEKITGYEKSQFRTLEDIQVELERQLSSIQCEQNHVEIAFFGGSFTGLPLSYQRALLELASAYVEQYKLRGIRFSTRPDYVTGKTIDFLQAYPVTAIELGVQSLDPLVLHLSKRGHTIEDVVQAVKSIRQSNIQLGIQLMTGLPGDTLERSLTTVKAVIALKPDFVRLYPTLVLEGTELAEWYRQGVYQPWTLEQTIEGIAEMLPMFLQANIPIIRLGLQQTEDLQKDSAVLAGPHHPNIRQLIETRYFYHLLDRLCEQLGEQITGKCCTIRINPVDETAVRGQKNSNLRLLADKYNCQLQINKDWQQPEKSIHYIK